MVDTIPFETTCGMVGDEPNQLLYHDALRAFRAMVLLLDPDFAKVGRRRERRRIRWLRFHLTFVRRSPGSGERTAAGSQLRR